MDIEAPPDAVTLKRQRALRCPKCGHSVYAQKDTHTHLPEPCEHLIRYERSLIEYRVSEDYDTGYDISGRGEYQSNRDDTLEDQLEGKTWDNLWMVYNKLPEYQLM